MLLPQKNRWKAYMMEFAGIGGFVLIGGLVAIFSEHPNMPLMEMGLQDHPTLRRIPLGILLGLYIFIISLLFGEKSGTHINPAVTWTFYRLGNINFKDAFLYTIAQFAGAVSGAFLLKLTLEKWFSHPNIYYGVTKPINPHGSTGAFISEWIISFITMWVILVISSSKKMEKKLPVVMGILLTMYIIIELPYSGMSMNPARSFAGAAAANDWRHLWIYFTSPLLAMLVASEVFLEWKRKKMVAQFAVSQNEKDDMQKIKNFPAT